MSVKKETHYATLGISKDATLDDIKKAYRKLSKEYHPDKPTGNEELFKEISEAHLVLIDPDSRAHYDSQLAGGMNNDKPVFTGKTQDTYSDIFNTRNDGSAPKRGQNRTASLTITLAESYQGVSTTVNVVYKTECLACQGKGKIETTDAPPCGSCGGTRKIVSETTNPFGHVAKTTRVCPDCRDQEIREETCTVCRGRTFIVNKIEVPIVVPAGVKDKQVVRIKGYGEPGLNGGETGDVMVTVTVEGSDQFIREGDSLIIEKQITYTQLVLGDSIDVPTPTGETSIKIPKGAQPNTRLKLKGMGMPSPTQGTNGDLIVVLKLIIPTEITAEMKELLRRLDN